MYSKCVKLLINEQVVEYWLSCTPDTPDKELRVIAINLAITELKRRLGEESKSEDLSIGLAKFEQGA